MTHLPTEEVLLSSITSTELRRVIFFVEDWRIRQIAEWARIDQSLCRLVDRLRAIGYCFALEAEFRLVDIGDYSGKYDFTQFLPEFSEKGIVIFIDAARGGRVLYSSTRIH